MRFPEAVEQWRPAVRQYFRPEDVDKALWVINYESSGNPAAMGDGGSSQGLFQLNTRGVGAGMSAAHRFNPYKNIEAAAKAVYGGQGWKPWGENNLHNGKKFGALGNHPFPGSQASGPGGQTSGRAMTSFALPVNQGRITQTFGPTNEKLDSGGVNKGIDVSVPVGTSVQAVTNGTVVSAGNSRDGWGTSVKIRDANGYIHNYGHLSRGLVKKGQTVRAGDVIAHSGNTGASTGPHLSYDVKDKNGNYVDPSPWLGFNAAGDNRTRENPILGQDISAIERTNAGGGYGGDMYRDPALQQQYEQFRDRVNEAYQAWISAGEPVSGPEAQALWAAQTQFSEFVSSTRDFLVPIEEGGGGGPSDDPAQRAFENAIALGDFNLREADAAFQKWFSQVSEARGAAANQVQGIQAGNSTLLDQASARAESATPGLVQRPAGRFQVPQPFEQLFGEYREKFGVNEPFTDTYTRPEITEPDTQAWFDEQQAAAAGAGEGPASAALQTPNAVNRDDTSHTPPHGHPASTTPFNKAPKVHPAVYDPRAVQRRQDDQDVDWNVRGTDNPWWFPGALGADKSKGTQESGNMPWWAEAPLAGAGLLGSAATATSREPFGAPARAAVSGAKKAGNTVRKWWQRGFAEGGTNIPGGPAWVGEQGPEIMEVPDFGRKLVGQQGPEQVNIPEGANVIPLEEAVALQKIQQAVQQSAQNPQQKQMEQQAAAQERANDPQLQQKVMEAIQKALASQWATDPPPTPTLEPGVKDRWQHRRQLTGIPADPQEAAAMREEQMKQAQKGGGGMPAQQRPQQQQQQQRPQQPAGRR